MEVQYTGGGSAILALERVDRTVTRVSVTVNYPTETVPFATFRSMFVADGNSDADHILWTDLSGTTHDDPIMTFGGGEATDWLFYRQTRSAHNISAPDIRIKLQTGG